MNKIEHHRRPLCLDKSNRLICMYKTAPRLEDLHPTPTDRLFIWTICSIRPDHRICQTKPLMLPVLKQICIYHMGIAFAILKTKGKLRD